MLQREPSGLSPARLATTALPALRTFSASHPGDTVWRQQAKLIADDAKAGDEFGYAVAINRDTVVVGAPYHEDNLLIGAAYVFVRDAATGNWHKQGDTLMSGVVRLGSSVAVASDRLAASGPYCECVQVYTRTSDVWSPDTVHHVERSVAGQ